MGELSGSWDCAASRDGAPGPGRGAPWRGRLRSRRLALPEGRGRSAIHVAIAVPSHHVDRPIAHRDQQEPTNAHPDQRVRSRDRSPGVPDSPDRDHRGPVPRRAVPGGGPCECRPHEAGFLDRSRARGLGLTPIEVPVFVRSNYLDCTLWPHHPQAVEAPETRSRRSASSRSSATFRILRVVP